MTATVDIGASPDVLPLSKCGACQQIDDHPKHQIMMLGVSPNDEKLFHEHDFDHTGCIYYHFDCPTPWHNLHERLATQPYDSPDPEEPWLAWTEESAAEHRLQADRHAQIMDWAASGIHGDELRQRIARLDIRGGAGGIDQTVANGILNALSPNSGTKTIGTLTITGPQHMRLMTANGSDTAAGTELATGSGYTAGGAALSFAAAATGAVSTNAAVSWTNMPASTLTGMEQWDTSATAQRIFWAPWTGGNITVGAGNTFTVASGSLTDSLA